MIARMFLPLTMLLLWGTPARADDGDEQYNFIAGLFDRGMHSMVVRESTKFLGDHERHERAPLVRYRMGQALFELGEFEKARDAFLPLDELGDRFQYRIETQFRIGQCLMQIEDFANAADRFAKLSADDQDHYLVPSAAYFAGEAFFRGESYNSAAKSYAKVISKAEDAGLVRSATYGLGWALYRTGQFDTAGRTFELYLQKYPNDDAVAEVRFLRGECLMEMDLAEQALNTYLRVPRGEYFDDALSAAGFAASDLGRHGEAARLFLRLESDCPQSTLLSEARLHAGIAAYQDADYDTATVALDRLVATADEEWMGEACYWRGKVAAKRETPDAALTWYAQGLGTKPDDALKDRLILARSDALFDAGRFDEAEEGYQMVQSGSGDTLYSAAVAALNSDDPDQAIARAEQLLKDFPDSPQAIGARLVVGEARFSKEEYVEASQAFQQVVEETKGEASHSERPRAISRLAWSLFYLERFEDSATTFNQLINEFPDDERAPEASFLEGRCRLRAGDFATAEAVLNRHLQAYRGTDYDDDARYDLAQALLEQGKKDAAQEMLDRVAAETSGGKLGLRASYDQAELAAAQGDHQKALKLTEPILAAEDVPDDLLRAALYAHAWSSYALQKWPDGEQSILRLLDGSIDPGPVALPALELLASIRRGSGDADGAVEAYQAMCQRDEAHPRTPEVALVAGLALKEVARTDDAATLLADACAKWPDFTGRDRLLFELAFLRQQQGNTQAYVDLLGEVEANYRDSALAPDAAFYRGETLFEAENYEDALGAFQRALAADSRVRDLALYKTAWCHFRLEQMENAAQNFFSLHSNHPESVVAAESLFLAGECLYRADHFEQAIAFLDQFVTTYPDHESIAKGRFRLGLSHGEQKQWAECLTSLNRLERDAPEFEHRSEADLWIGRALFAQDRLDEAERRFQNVASNERGLLGANAHLGLGDILMKRNAYEDALGEFLKVVLLYESDEEVGEALWRAGQCLERSGDGERAVRQYQELLEKYPTHPRAAAAKARLTELGV